MGEAEALTMSDEAELDGRAGRIIEQALTLDPNSGKALFFGAAAAVRRGDLALGKARFEKLLSLNPPEAIRPILQQQIAGLEQRMANAGSGGVGTGGAGNGPMASGSASSSAPTASPTSANAGSAAVRVHIELSPALSKTAPDAAPLFVFVRDPGQPGPPLAAKRLANRFPQTVELTPADSMVPGRVFAAGQKVQGGGENCALGQSHGRQWRSFWRSRIPRRSRRPGQHRDRSRHPLSRTAAGASTGRPELQTAVARGGSYIDRLTRTKVKVLPPRFRHGSCCYVGARRAEGYLHELAVTRERF